MAFPSFTALRLCSLQRRAGAVGARRAATAIGCASAHHPPGCALVSARRLIHGGDLLAVAGALTVLAGCAQSFDSCVDTRTCQSISDADASLSGGAGGGSGAGGAAGEGGGHCAGASGSGRK